MPFDNANLDDATRILIDARAYIERGWCIRAQARDAAGRDVCPTSPYAVQWCAAGALVAAGVRELSSRDPAYARLIRAIGDGHSGPAPFNNAQINNKPVLLAFDRAIADRS